MLKNKQISISVSQQVVIGEEVVMGLSATIPSDTKIGVVGKHVSNEPLYQANRAACRKDLNDFQQEIYAIEDNYPLMTDIAVE